MWIRRSVGVVSSDELFVRRALFLVRIHFMLYRELVPFELLEVPQTVDLGSPYVIYDSLLL